LEKRTWQRNVDMANSKNQKGKEFVKRKKERKEDKITS